MTGHRTDWAALFKILKASPDVTSLDIFKWHENRYPSLQKLGEVCGNLRLMRLCIEAWSPIRSAGTGETFESDGTSCFQMLQRLRVWLDFNACMKQEALSRLKVIVAACKSMQQIDIAVSHKDERKESVLAAVKALGRENPSMWFIVEDRSVPPKRLIAVKSNRFSESQSLVKPE